METGTGKLCAVHYRPGKSGGGFGSVYGEIIFPFSEYPIFGSVLFRLGHTGSLIFV